jgi:DNA-binding cell septation regulator SpoVG
MNIAVKITPHDRSNPTGKLADAEVHFIDGELDGLKLIGFTVWERRGRNGRTVTFPARQYAVNGEHRSFALLRPISDVNAQNRVRELVLQAYTEHEQETAETLVADPAKKDVSHEL